MAHKRIPELQSVDFNGSASIAQYSKAGRDLARDFAWELHESAAELEAILKSQKGHPLLMGIDVKLRAKRVTNRLRRASEGCVGVAAEMVKFNKQYRVEFISPAQEAKRKEKSKKKWNFED